MGVVGAGFGANVHVPAFRLDPRCVVAGLCSLSMERARAAAERLGIEHAFNDWRAMVTDPAIDALSIAVPPALQPAVVATAAEAGKHVFCEKPAGPDSAQVRTMLAAVQARGIVHAVDFMFPEIDAWRRAKAVLDARGLGRLRQVVVSWRVETRAHRDALDSWKVRPEDGGGTLNNFVSHSFFYLEWLCGPIRKLNARLRPRDAGSEARVDAWLEFGSGVPGALSVAADAFLGPGHRLEIYGDQGTLVLENRTADYARGFQLCTGTRQTRTLIEATAAEPDGSVDGRIAAVASIARRFLGAISGGAPAKPDLADGLRVQQLIDAARDSERLNRWQEL